MQKALKMTNISETSLRNALYQKKQKPVKDWLVSYSLDELEDLIEQYTSMKSGKGIFGYNTRDKKIRKFAAQSFAARELGISHSCVSRAITGRYEMVDGWYFSKTLEELQKKIKNNFAGKYHSRSQSVKRSVPLVARNIKTGEVIRFESHIEASKKLGIKYSALWEAVNIRKVPIKGYFFEYGT